MIKTLVTVVDLERRLYYSVLWCYGKSSRYKYLINQMDPNGIMECHDCGFCLQRISKLVHVSRVTWVVYFMRWYWLERYAKEFPLPHDVQIIQFVQVEIHTFIVILGTINHKINRSILCIYIYRYTVNIWWWTNFLEKGKVEFLFWQQRHHSSPKLPSISKLPSWNRLTSNGFENLSKRSQSIYACTNGWSASVGYNCS